MSNPRKAKGTRIEHEVKKMLCAAGVPTRRVIGSGAHGWRDERLVGDLQIGLCGAHSAEWLLTGEVKGRKKFNNKQFEAWLGDNDLLFLREDGDKEPRVYMPWKTFQALVYAFYQLEVREKMENVNE